MKFSIKNIFFFSLLSAPSFVFAATYSYSPLLQVTRPGGESLYSSNILEYLKNIYSFGIAIVGGLAVIKIVYGGVKYMLTDIVTDKSAAKKEINAAVIGLLVALGSATLLYTINPKLLTLNFNLEMSTKDPLLGDGRSLIEATNSGTTAEGGTGGANRPSSTGKGSVLELMNKDTRFPDPAWNAYALEQINKSGLLDLSPSDASIYFPNGVTAEGYLNLIASVASKESAFKPGDMYWEDKFKTPKYSVGLLSLSYDDYEVKKLGYTQEDLKDPYKNIEAGVQIFKRTIQKGGAINGGTSSGATSYWSTLR